MEDRKQNRRGITKHGVGGGGGGEANWTIYGVAVPPSSLPYGKFPPERRHQFRGSCQGCQWGETASPRTPGNPGRKRGAQQPLHWRRGRAAGHTSCFITAQRGRDREKKEQDKRQKSQLHLELLLGRVREPRLMLIRTEILP